MLEKPLMVLLLSHSGPVTNA